MKRIEIEDLALRPFHILDKEWALLVAGREKPNPMTVSWGSFGTLWNRPAVTVYVRPTRYTCGLLSTESEFTLNILPEAMRPALDLCGSCSGRDTDKWAAAGLSREPSAAGSVPRVRGARLAMECRVLATLDLDPSRFLDSSVENLYPEKDYHRIFIGQVLTAWEA